jgi:hypothetical protein
MSRVFPQLARATTLRIKSVTVILHLLGKIDLKKKTATFGGRFFLLFLYFHGFKKRSVQKIKS